MDTPPDVRLHLVVGYDGSPPASRALAAAVRLLQGRHGQIMVVYVAHVPSLDMMSVDALALVEADFDEIAKDLLASAAEELGPHGVAWEFQRRQGLIAEELIAAASAIEHANPGDTTVIVAGSSSHASHRIIGSVAVSLARHCPVPLMIVPLQDLSSTSGCAAADSSRRALALARSPPALPPTDAASRRSDTVRKGTITLGGVVREETRQMIPSDRAHDPASTRRGSEGPRRLAPRALVSAVQGRFAGSAAETFLRRLGALDFVQSIIVFGASLLLSALPFVILMSSLANHRIDVDLSRHIGLDRQGANVVGQLFAPSSTHPVADIAIALIVATAGTMAVANSLQAIYERAFGQEPRGWRDVLRYLTWVGVLFGVLVADNVISNPVHASLGPVGEGFVSYAGAAAFFWWTMYFLLAGRVPGRVLVRTALLTALLWVGLELFSSAYFSSEIVSDSKLYGKIGVVFGLLTWFIAIGAVIVLGTAMGATWEQRKGRLGGPEAGSEHSPSGGSNGIGA